MFRVKESFARGAHIFKVTHTSGLAGHQPECDAEDIQGADERVQGQHQTRHPAIRIHIYINLFFPPLGSTIIYVGV